MIDEDRTYENEVRYNNDRLDNRKDRQSIKINIHWTWRVQVHRKYYRKKKINND